jgi:hypothetical protein
MQQRAALAIEAIFADSPPGVPPKQESQNDGSTQVA